MLTPDQVRYLKEKWAPYLENEVIVGLVTSENCKYCPLMKELLDILSNVSMGKINVKISAINDVLKRFLGVDRGPISLIGNKGEVRYTGSPIGEETWAFLETLKIASTKRHGLEKYEESLRDLDRTVRIETIVTPSCPYCPYAVLLANKIALASGGKVVSDTVEAYEFQDIASKFGVTSVPTIVISVDSPYSGEVFKIGVPKESELIWKVLKVGRLQ